MIVAEPVRALAAARGAEDWLAGLPGLVAELEREWGVTAGAPYGGATEAYVAAATTAAGEPAVLKLLVPRTDGPGGGAGPVGNEATVLRLADGAGCVRLLAADDARGALLLERLGPSLSELGLPIEQRHAILVDAARALWRPAPDSELPTAADKARRLAEDIAALWETLRRPCSEAAVRQALDAAVRRWQAHDDRPAVLLHGDVHQWNTLRTLDGTGYRLVDPDGYVGEPESDLGVLMREDLDELMAGDPCARATWLAERTGTDPAAIWDWGLVERMSNGLMCLIDGLEDFGRTSLAAADRIAAAG